MKFFFIEHIIFAYQSNIHNNFIIIRILEEKNAKYRFQYKILNTIHCSVGFAWNNEEIKILI
jgi:hypothetical protein